MDNTPKRKRTRGKEYLNKQEFYDEMIKCKENGVLSERAKNMFVLLANQTIKKKTYYNPDDKFDCLQEGLLALITRQHNFDTDISNNAFAYYTEIFKRGMAKGLNDIYNKNMKTVSISELNDGNNFYSNTGNINTTHYD